jgi:hypothetical protein
MWGFFQRIVKCVTICPGGFLRVGGGSAEFLLLLIPLLVQEGAGGGGASVTRDRGIPRGRSDRSADPRFWGLRFFLGFTLPNPQACLHLRDLRFFLRKSRRPQRRKSALHPLFLRTPQNQPPLNAPSGPSKRSAGLVCRCAAFPFRFSRPHRRASACGELSARTGSTVRRRPRPRTQCVRADLFWRSAVRSPLTTQSRGPRRQVRAPLARRDAVRRQ